MWSYNLLCTGSSQQMRWDIITPLYGISRPHYKALTWTPQTRQSQHGLTETRVETPSITTANSIEHGKYLHARQQTSKHHPKKPEHGWMEIHIVVPLLQYCQSRVHL